MTDGINNNGYYDDSSTRSTARVRREALDRPGRLLVTRRPVSERPRQQPFQQVMENFQSDAGERLPATLPSDTVEAPQNPQESLAPQEQPATFREAMERRGRERDGDRDTRKTRSDSGPTERPRGKEAEQRVVGHGSLSDRGGDGKGKGKGNGQGGEGSNHWQGNRFNTVALLQDMKGVQKGKIQELGQAPFLQNLKQMHAAQQKKAPTPTIFSKELLDQVVHYVKILSRPDGEKEMEVSLHEKIFKGLRLRVATVRSKVDATFLTHSDQVRNLFLSHKRDIESALAEKGIDVGRINVIII